MRKGFTLVELIFVIVIIGVLAAVAVPKFKNLKQGAEVGNVIKMVKDAESGVPNSAVNMSDLEDNSTYVLTDILSLSGKNIAATNSGNTYEINASTTSNIATIDFDRADRNVTVTIDCDAFADTISQDKCAKQLGVTKSSDTTPEYSSTITF